MQSLKDSSSLHLVLFICCLEILSLFSSASGFLIVFISMLLEIFCASKHHKSEKI